MAELTKLGKYEIRRELGRGAMGVVYEAFDPLIERAVAIKTILKSSIDKSEMEEAFSRFRREARAAGRLSHPKIVSVYEYGEDDDMAFIVMELIRGRELKEYFDHEDRFSIKDGIRIVLQLLDALDYSHTHGVVHRDIKPANIMITVDGQVKIADFGIAKIDSSSLTQVGIVLGTPTYMSPEQFIGKGVDHRTDIYSCGVLLYQFLTGERPFTGSVITIMHKAVNQDAVPPSQFNPDVSPELDEVVSRAMAKRPADRYQSAAEFMQALKAAGKTVRQMQALPAMQPSRPLIGADEMFDITDKTIILPGSKNVARKTEAAAGLAVADNHPEPDHAAPQRKRAKPTGQLNDRKPQKTVSKEALARKIAEIKSEATELKAAEIAQQKKAAEARAQRVNMLAATLSERADKFAAVVSARETERETEQRMEAEAKRKLEEEVQRKKTARDVRRKRHAVEEPVLPVPNMGEIQAASSGITLPLEVAVTASQPESLVNVIPAHEMVHTTPQRKLLLLVGVVLVVAVLGMVLLT